ncbi:MAG: feruloyl-CoA synthase [Betaproteobacteria bacterium]|nr:feruloyl-CoA synthase [Betaproteobacteria bacterium]MBU6511530.1 feruloyl-CoA synthase [Betaproteobacteria bacterium]MDE1955002.1 feruloyl-CoA synthase [Betaproteobacteria bacterium]MDE2151106.1 feruloyl-CoA synthase [Betaproteobacteria bacterium]
MDATAAFASTPSTPSRAARRRAPARACSIGGCVRTELERRADGTMVLRSPEPLGEYPQRLTDRLEHWARVAPQRVFAARRGADGQWVRIDYAQMLDRARRIATALLARGLDAEHPILVLGENSLEHLQLALGAMLAGIPHAPVSPAYALVSRDYAKLRHVVQTLTPGLVFASDAAYEPALRAVIEPDVEVLLARGALQARASTGFETLLQAQPLDLRHTHEKVGPDTIAKFLFTSGSTRNPKGVVNTQRMLCANQQMILQAMPFLGEQPPVLVDWLPWNHTFGGNHNVGIALYNGGTLYIDDGKPTPQGIGETLRNLREIAPTVYFNVPKGFEEIASAMRQDAGLRERLFSQVRAFFFAGAGLSQAVWDELDALGEAEVGERICMLTGLGMTETAPSSMFALGPEVESGHIGLPVPGVELKLVPLDGKLEVRFRGPNVMPGYWRAPEQSAEAFDEEGYYRTGDAARFVDPEDPQRGLRFDGRIAEDFKLSSGTFVSCGPLRARIAQLGAPCVHDAVLTAPDRDELGALILPRVDECRALAALPAGTPAAQVLEHPAVRAFFQTLVDALWEQGTGSANRVARACVLAEAASLDRGEITDKGSINQRAVLQHRAQLVDALYRGDAPGLLLPRAKR